MANNVPSFLVATVFYLHSVLSASNGLQASFYGDSYVRIPVQDASSSTDIKLHFRTSSPNGLLLLAAGTTDYCKILLQSGTLQASLDLGSGEATLVSPPGIVFNDLQWHLVHLSRIQSRVVLSIDGIYSSEAASPGPFFELNIDRDVFAGGTGAFDGRIFFGNFRSFRGCLRNVTFNGVDVLRTGSSQLHSLHVYAVTWDCAPEFGATSDQPISFMRNASYIAFPPLEARQEGRVTFDLRTRSGHALVVYNSGTLVASDFLALEIVEGYLKLRVNRGSGAVSLTTDKVVNDGSWHQIEMVIDAVSARLTVDGRRKEERIDFGNTRFLDVTTLLYVGGVGVVARSVAVQKELESLTGSRAAGGSLIGCIQNFKVDGRLLGFRDAVVSRDIQPECAWTFPCASQPCVDGSRCIEDGHYVYRCLCAVSNCYRNDSTVTRLLQHPSTTVHDVLQVQDLVVREGGKSVLSTNNIDLMVQYSNRGIRDSYVSFKVLDHPNYGEVIVEGGRRSPRPTSFTLADLKESKVWYLNNGSEATTDRIVLQLEFLLVGRAEVEDHFRRKYRFTLMIQIAPWNDPPEIHLPPDDTLILITSTQMRISPKLINATDRDDPSSSLEYTVLYQQGFDVGYFELNDNLGVRARITRFLQEDINEGRLSFVHRGLQHQQLNLQVSDGKDIGFPKTLKISAIPLTISSVANTGLVVARGSNRLLTRQNLTFTSNAPGQDIEIRYVVTDLPYEGEIQRQQYADNRWIVVSTFTQNHIDRGRVRYLHNGTSRAEGDYFEFKVTAMNVEMERLEFYIRIVNVTVDIVRSVGLTLRGARERVVTSDELKAVSTVPDHGPDDVVYGVLTLPRYGQLLRSEQTGQQLIQKKNLTIGSNFSQSEVNQKQISYKPLRAQGEGLVDEFEFVVSIPGFTSKRNQFQFVYEPTVGDLVFTNNGLMDVLEGQSKRISREDLFVANRNSDAFEYHITGGPRHGVVQIVTPDETGTTVITFTNEDIKNGRLLYKHDGSETEEDSFNFTALFERNDPQVKDVSGTFEVKILFQNDNGPRPTVDRTFHVVVNRGRVITTDDMFYIDPDVDFDSSNLEYDWRDIPNGFIVFRETSQKNYTVTKFLQRHVVDGLLYFVHNGANHSKSLITVSDGLHFTSHIQEVQASDPFITVFKDSFLFVNRGQISALLTTTLGIHTNMDISDKDIRFVVLEPPSHGQLKLGDRDCQHFTWADVKNHLVLYKHDDSEGMEDDFGFVVRAEELEVRGRTAVRVTQIVIKVAEVKEFESVIIDEHLLNVSNSHTSTMNITYLVNSSPRHGLLTLVNRQENNTHLQVFTQNDINNGHLRYQHTAKGQYVDAFHFAVQLDNIFLIGQTFHLEITPTHGSVPFHLRNLTVVEGSSVYLTEDTFIFKSTYVESRSVEFLVIGEPRHGRLQNEEVPLYPVTQFTLDQVRNRKILYVHDGSETRSDRLIVIVRVNSSNDGQGGPPKILWIIVKPANDAAPRIKINKKLHVWQGSKAPITKQDLLTEDDDTNPEDLTYFISQPTNGDVTRLQSRSSDVTATEFTQADVNNNLVVFLHRAFAEPSTGFFKFNVSDGAHYLAHETFQIEIESLSLTLVTSGPLGVFPGLVQPILSSVLKARTNDPLQPRPISYTLQRRPLYGKLVTFRDNILDEVNSFSQEEIDSGAIYYKHNITSLVGQSAEDSFVFDASTAYAAALRAQTLSICVSYEAINADNRDQFLVVRGASVSEGGSVTIDKASLDVTKYKRKLLASGLRAPEVYFVLHDLPIRGSLVLNGGTSLMSGYNFTQKEINRDNIIYKHDHSESQTDSFSFVMKVEFAGKQSLRSMCTLPPLVSWFNISIRQINDQTYTLLTHSPSVELVQGSFCVITDRNLKTTDPDTPPSDIIYKITNSPDGYVAFSSYPTTPIQAFTQRDIDGEAVIFVHDGTHGSGAFYFSVSDGVHEPLYKVFNISVVPSTLEMVSLEDVELLQGHYSTVVTAKNIVVKTNARSSQITYNVTREPANGRLYVNDMAANHFSHAQVEEGLLVYMQVDLRSANDSFEFLLSDNMQNMIFNQRLNVVVKPNLKIGERPVQGSVQRSVRVTLRDLDATELAIVTGSDPLYEVTRGPIRGRLVLSDSAREGRRRKKVRRRVIGRDTRVRKERGKDGSMGKNGREKVKMRNLENALFRFTHDDIVNERVEYRPSEAFEREGRREGGGGGGGGGRAMSSGQPLQDNFTFILSARNAQPVTQTLWIDLNIDRVDELERVSPSVVEEQSSPTPFQTTTTTSVEPVQAENPPEKVGKNHLLIVFLISGITVMALAGFIVFKCLRRKKKVRSYRSTTTRSDGAASSLSAVPAIAITSSSSPAPMETVAPQRTQSPKEPSESSDRPRSTAPPRTTPPSRLKRQEAIMADSPPSSPKTASKAGYVRIVPPQKDPGTPLEDQGTTITPGGTIRKEQVIFDWENVDPELLQHCRKTNPILHKNQYWV